MAPLRLIGILNSVGRRTIGIIQVAEVILSGIIITADIVTVTSLFIHTIRMGTVT